MVELLTLDLVSKRLVTEKLVLTIGYDIENITDNYNGSVTIDYYGRAIPKHAHGTINLDYKTSSSKIIQEAMIKLYDRIINPKLSVRRITIALTKLASEEDEKDKVRYRQLDLFSSLDDNKLDYDKEVLKKENNLQNAMLKIKEKYGKNAILKGMDLEDGATTIERNRQIGGHHE